MIRIGPFADIIIVTSTSPERRAFIVSLERLIWNSLSVIALMMAAVLVTSSGGITVEGIRPLYGMQLILCLLTLLYLTYSLPPTVGRIGLQGSYKQKLSSIFGEYLDAFKGRSILSDGSCWRTVQTFGLGLAALSTRSGWWRLSAPTPTY